MRNLLAQTDLSKKTCSSYSCECANTSRLGCRKQNLNQFPIKYRVVRMYATLKYNATLFNITDRQKLYENQAGRRSNATFPSFPKSLANIPNEEQCEFRGGIWLTMSPSKNGAVLRFRKIWATFVFRCPNINKRNLFVLRLPKFKELI